MRRAERATAHGAERASLVSPSVPPRTALWEPLEAPGGFSRALAPALSVRTAMSAKAHTFRLISGLTARRRPRRGRLLERPHDHAVNQLVELVGLLSDHGRFVIVDSAGGMYR